MFIVYTDFRNDVPCQVPFDHAPQGGCELRTNILYYVPYLGEYEIEVRRYDGSIVYHNSRTGFKWQRSITSRAAALLGEELGIKFVGYGITDVCEKGAPLWRTKPLAKYPHQQHWKAALPDMTLEAMRYEILHYPEEKAP